MTFRIQKRQALYAGVAAVAALAGAGLAWRRYTETDIAPGAMSDFWSAELESPSGDLLRMAAFQGKPLVINFWATWCTPCVDEMPLIDAFFRQNKEKGWQVLGLAIDQPSKVRQFLTQYPVSYAIALAGLNGTELGKNLGNEVGGLPFTVVLDAKGRVIQRKLGKLSKEDMGKWSV